MFVRSNSALDRIRQVRRAQRIAVIFTGSVFAAGSLYSFAVRSQKEKAKPIVKQALSICRAFAVNCQSDGEPRFVHEQVPLPYTRNMKRPMWYVPIHADGLNYVMMLRADTGRLCYVFNLSPWENFVSTQSTQSKSVEANRAANQSLIYLQRLKVVAPETQIAMEGQPELFRDDTAWRMVWKTRSTPNASEENLRVVVSQKNGRLLQVADSAALNEIVK